MAGVFVSIDPRRLGVPGDYLCSCGRRYRVGLADGRLRFWPQVGLGRFGREPVADGSGCLGCGEELNIPEADLAVGA